MNINQAKAVAAINWNLRSRAEIQRASDHCKALIVAARKSNDDEQAARLSEARQVFKNRLKRNTCPICGVRIAPTAERCRIHPRVKIGAIGPAIAPTSKTKSNGNSRMAMAVIPAGIWGAVRPVTGFFTEPVQAVLRKWKDKIEPKELAAYFDKICSCVLKGGTRLEFDLIPDQKWQAIFEMGAALLSVYYDRNKPEAWLMRQEINLTKFFPDYSFASWKTIREGIIFIGGPSFSINQLTQAAKRMKITPTKEHLRIMRDARERRRCDNAS